VRTAQRLGIRKGSTLFLDVEGYDNTTSACNQPVYFVRDEWVRERYEHEHPGWNNGRHRGQEKHDDHGNHGNNGKGHGHDKDKH